MHHSKCQRRFSLIGVTVTFTITMFGCMVDERGASDHAQSAEPLNAVVDASPVFGVVRPIDIGNSGAASKRLDQTYVKTLVRRDDAGRVVHLAIIGGDAPTPNTDEESRLATLRQLVNAHYRDFGLRNRDDLAELEVFASEAGPSDPGPSAQTVAGSMRFPRQEGLGVEQSYRDVRMGQGTLWVEYLDGAMVVVSGRFYAESEVRDRIDAVLDGHPVTYEAAKQSAAEACTLADEATHSKNRLTHQLFYLRGLVHYAFVCKDSGETVGVDASSGEVLWKLSHLAHDLRWSPQRLGVRTIKRGIPFWGVNSGWSPKTQNIGQAWLPPAPGWRPPANQLDQRLELDTVPLPVDRIQAVGGCFFGLSTNRQDSCDSLLRRCKPDTWSLHAPLVVDGASGVAVMEFSPQCSATTLSMISRSSRPSFDYSSTFAEVSRVAQFLQQSEFHVMASRRPAAPKLRVKYDVHTRGNACGSKDYYDHVNETVCMDTAEPYNPWYLPIHEFGHFVRDMYGQNPGFPPIHGCHYWAAHEGHADGFLLMTEHFRQNPNRLEGTPNYEVNMAQLLRSGPGEALLTGLEHVGIARPNTELSSELLQADVNIECRQVTIPIPTPILFGTPPLQAPVFIPIKIPVPGSREHYYYGKVISQILWKLLLNRKCVFDQEDTCSRAERILTSMSDREAAEWAREAFTFSQKSTHLRDYLASMLTHYLVTGFLSGSYLAENSQDLERLVEAFAEHGITIQ